MADAASKRIAIDDVVESAAAGVLRALSAREGAGRTGAVPSAVEFVKSGFIVDFLIRVGGNPGPIDVAKIGQLGAANR
jgi:hypothetical protein